MILSPSTSSVAAGHLCGTAAMTPTATATTTTYVSGTTTVDSTA